MPECKKDWEEPTEQAKAIVMEGKCIVCMIEKGEKHDYTKFKLTEEQYKEYDRKHGGKDNEANRKD